MESAQALKFMLNLGPKSGQLLPEADITTTADLERLGPVVAYRLGKQRQPQYLLEMSA